MANDVGVAGDAKCQERGVMIKAQTMVYKSKEMYIEILLFNQHCEINSILVTKW